MQKGKIMLEILSKQYTGREEIAEEIPPEITGYLEPILLPILCMGKKIRRHVYENYDEGVIKDNVYGHIRRSIALAKALPLPEEIKTEVVKTFLLHDLPEVSVLTERRLDHDLTAPEKKANPDLAEEVEKAELQKAKEIFTTDELKLFDDFEDVGSFIKGKSEEKAVHPSALIAYIIDKIDANILMAFPFF